MSLETEALEELPSVSDEEPDAPEDDFRDLEPEPEPEPELEPDSE